jgi:hypothetical protein
LISGDIIDVSSTADAPEVLQETIGEINFSTVRQNQ